MLFFIVLFVGLGLACFVSQKLYGDMAEVFTAMLYMVLSFAACALFAFALSWAAFGFDSGWFWVCLIICVLSYFSLGRLMLVGAALGATGIWGRRR
jgi:hypothetical protein